MIEPTTTLELAALLHNVQHLIYRLSIGAKQHQQDVIDARRWLPEIERALKGLPEPLSRVAVAGDLGGADCIERYYEPGRAGP